MKKILSVVLTVALVMSMLPAFAVMADGVTSEGVVYASKFNNIQGNSSVLTYGQSLMISGYKMGSAYNRQAVLRFDLTAYAEELAEADGIYLSVGVNDSLDGYTPNDGNKYGLYNLVEKNAVLDVAAISNLNDTWTGGTAVADMLASGTALQYSSVAKLDKRGLVDIKGDGVYDDPNIDSHRWGNYVRSNHGGTFCDYVKDQIEKGDYVIDLIVQVDTQNNTSEFCAMYLLGDSTRGYDGSDYINAFRPSIHWFKGEKEDVNDYKAPSIDYVFKGEDAYYLFGTTDGRVSDLGVEIASANVKAQNASFKKNGDADKLAQLNDVKKFGFEIQNPDDVIGNTLMFTPWQLNGTTKMEGKMLVTKNKVNDTTAKLLNPREYTSQDFTGKYVTISGNKMYSIKTTSFKERDGEKSDTTNSPATQLTCWDSTHANYRLDRRNVMMQFPLTEEMLDAETITLSVGVQYSHDNGMWQEFYNNNYTLGLYEITGLSNNWDIGADTDITGLVRTPITTFEETATLDESGNRVDGNVKYVEASIKPSSGVQTNGKGVVLTHTDEAFTSYIKNKIRNGEKVINISIEGIGAKDRLTGEPLTAGGFFNIGGELTYSNTTLRPWREPFAPALIWE